MTRLLVLLAAVTFSGFTMAAQATDPVSGTWELNVAKSKYMPASMKPRSQTRVIEVKGQQETGRHTIVDAQGLSSTVEYTANYDGKQYPYKGHPDWQTLVIKRIDAYRSEVRQTGAGKAVISGTRVVSQDGKTMTVTIKGTNAKGEPVAVTMVFDKK